MSFLSHVIFSGGIVVDLSKVDMMLQWEAPKSVTVIRHFMGLASYYRYLSKAF